LRERVLTSAARAPRLVRFTNVVARLLDVSTDKAREFLAAIDEPEQWQTTPFEGVTRMPVEGGPRTDGAVAHFVRIEPGKVVPLHEHLGPEIGIFLQGRGQGDDGRTFGPGDRFGDARRRTRRRSVRRFRNLAARSDLAPARARLFFRPPVAILRRPCDLS
jgi:anti-sigma factor ChrR (cupin superfamily)